MYIHMAGLFQHEVPQQATHPGIPPSKRTGSKSAAPGATGPHGPRRQAGRWCWCGPAHRPGLWTNLPSGELSHSNGKWPFIVDFPIKNGGSFHCYVSSPEGTSAWGLTILIHPVGIVDLLLVPNGMMTWWLYDFLHSRSTNGTSKNWGFTLWLCQNSYWKWQLKSWIFPLIAWWIFQ